MIRQYVVFGQRAIDCVFDGDWNGLNEVLDDTPSCIGYRDFNTEEECNAYICGLRDMAGWMESCIMTDEDVENLKEVIDLSYIENLEDVY